MGNDLSIFGEVIASVWTLLFNTPLWYGLTAKEWFLIGVVVTLVAAAISKFFKRGGSNENV